MVKRFLIACVALLCVSYAQAQVTEQFGTFVGGLPNATSVSNADALYVLQGGVSKRVSPSVASVVGAPAGSILWNNAGSLAGFGNYNGTGTIKLGVDVGAPVTQKIAGQSAIAGGTANVAGANLVLQGGQSVGSANGGAVQIFTSPAGASGTNQNAAVEVVRIDSNSFVTINSGGFGPQDNYDNLQLITTTANGGNGFGLYSFTNNNSQSTITFFNSRNATVGAQGALNNNDWIGSLEFQGSDGTAFHSVGRIVFKADGGFSTNSLPGRVEFYTTANGANNPLSRMRLDNAGQLTIGGTASQDLNPTNWGNHNTPLEALSTVGANLGLITYTTGTTSPSGLYIGKINNSTIGNQGANVSGDILGVITFFGSDSVKFTDAARIESYADGNFSTNTVFGRLTFLTNPGGNQAAPLERMRIDSKGHVNYTTTAPTASACAGFALSTGSSDTAGRVTFTSATSCAISFATAFTNAPFCSVIPGSAASTVTITTSTTVLTATFGTAQTAMFYQCFGN